jgi:hypothetical protein
MYCVKIRKGIYRFFNKPDCVYVLYNSGVSYTFERQEMFIFRYMMKRAECTKLVIKIWRK